MKDSQDNYADVHGLKLYYQVHGAGEPRHRRRSGRLMAELPTSIGRL